ncbi:MAG: metallophosphoesterase family protein [Mucinivorans sp.]
MKIQHLLVVLLCTMAFSTAKGEVLKFGTDNKFKIVQFTDVHYQFGNPKSAVAIELITEVLEREKPNFVVFTGDVVFAKPAIEGLKEVFAPLLERNIPFTMVFGNHDNEFDASHEKLFAFLQTMPLCQVCSDGPLSGWTNYALPIKSVDKKRDAAALYCLDSHSYSKIKGIEGYDYIKRDQINWYCQQSQAFTKSNNNTPLPSLSFFHIPLPEYQMAVSDQSVTMRGIRREIACSPKLNSGLFAAFKECGDVMGIFVGHDHDNDYAVAWQGILLCYGRYTGGDTVYNNLENGARVIELTQDQREFKSWIRLKGNRIEQMSCFPSDFTKK